MSTSTASAGRAFLDAGLAGSPPRLAMDPSLDVPLMTLCRDHLGEDACATAVEARLSSASDADRDMLCGLVATNNTGMSRYVAAGCERATGMTVPPLASALRPLHTMPAVYTAPTTSWAQTNVAFLVAFAVVAALLTVWIWIPTEAIANAGEAGAYGGAPHVPLAAQVYRELSLSAGGAN